MNGRSIVATALAGTALSTLCSGWLSPASAAVRTQSDPALSAHTQIAHRGFLNWGAPESSHAAVRHAIQKRYAGVELDVRWSKDNKGVVLHDRTLDRTTTCTGSLSSYTVKALAKCDASSPTVKAGVNSYLSTASYIQKLSHEKKWWGTFYVHVKERLSSTRAAELVKGANILSDEERRVVFVLEEPADRTYLVKAGWDGKDEGRTGVERIGLMVHSTEDWNLLLSGKSGLSVAIPYGRSTKTSLVGSLVGTVYDAVVTPERVAGLAELGIELNCMVEAPQVLTDLLGLGCTRYFV